MLKLIWQEISSIFLGRRLVFFLSVAAFTCACVGINASLTCTLQEAAERNAAESTYGGKTAFKILMDGDSDSYTRVFGYDNTENVKRLFHALKSETLFTFRYTKENLVDFFDPNDPDYAADDFPLFNEAFRVGYETGTATYDDGYLALKAFYADTLFCDDYGVSIEEGRAFMPEDFVVTDPERITLPVLLGSDYKGLYQVGDQIPNAHFGTLQTITLDVIGFFSRGSYFFDCNTTKQILDRYMVIPSIETAYAVQQNGGCDDLTHAAYDSFKLCNTRILCEQSETEAVRAHITELMRAYGFSELYLFEESEGYARYLQHAREDTVTSMVITAFIVVMIVIMVCIQTCCKIIQNQKRYCILMLNGITRGQLFMMSSAESFVMFILSAALFLAVKYVLGDTPWFDFGMNQYSLAVILMVEVLLLGLIGYYGVSRIQRLDISAVLREHE